MKKGPTFPPSKIKKIIQQNQQVGKLSNVVPHLVEKSLQLFLIDVIDKVNQIAESNEISKATPCLLRKAIEQMPKYQFMKFAVEELQQFQGLKKKKSQIKVEKMQRKKSSKSEIQQQNAPTSKKSRKKLKQEKEPEIQERDDQNSIQEQHL